METHPVPQNVTAFEFHLIGDMTMRQFGYLAASLAFAYVVFLLFASQVPLVAYPIIAISVLIGAAYAFLPIMDRPLDHWTVAFIKAITNPTIRKYDPTRLNSDDSRFKDRLNVYLQQLQAAEAKNPKKTITLAIHPTTSVPTPIPEETKPQSADNLPKVESLPEKPVTNEQPGENKNELSKEESTKPGETNISSQPNPTTNAFLQNLNTLAQQPAQPPVTPVQPLAPPTSNPAPPPNLPTTEELLSHPMPTPPVEEKLPSEEDLDKTISLAKQAQVVQDQIIAAEKQIDVIKSGSVRAGVNTQTYTQEFQAVLTTLQKLNQKARDISHELAELSSAEKPNTLINEPAIKPNIIPTLTLTSIPNILNGIVTDSQGNYIEGAIIVAHDRQGLPVRALKTNKLGQFIAATPLSSGTYTISVEKDDLSFDVVQVELADKILNPVVISAKKGGA